MTTLTDDVLEVLNSALDCDPEAVSKLILNRVPCNEKLADHDHVTVAYKNDEFRVGLIGFVNAILTKHGCDRVSFMYHKDYPDSVIGFVPVEQENNDE